MDKKTAAHERATRAQTDRDDAARRGSIRRKLVLGAEYNTASAASDGIIDAVILLEIDADGKGNALIEYESGERALMSPCQLVKL